MIRKFLLLLAAASFFNASAAPKALSFSAPITDPQLVTLRAGVCADNTARPLMQAGNGPALNAWMNTTTATLGWRTEVTKAEMDEAPNYSNYDTLATGKRDSWSRLLGIGEGYRDFSKNKVRNWVVDIWGPATASSNSEAILLAATEAATNAQNIVGGTVKTTGTVTATARGYVSLVTTPETTRLIFQPNGVIYPCP